MQHVNVRDAGKRRLEAMQQVAGLDQWQIERLAVIRYDRSATVSDFGDGFEQYAFGGEAGQKELSDAQTAILIPGTADEKGIGACAARETRCLEVNEQH